MFIVNYENMFESDIIFIMNGQLQFQMEIEEDVKKILNIKYKY